MIDIQEDRMGIGTDDRIIFRNFGLYKILVSLKSLIILQTDLGNILQYKTQKSGCNTEVVQSLHPLISNYPFIFYLFTLLLYYLFTLYNIDTL